MFPQFRNYRAHDKYMDYAKATVLCSNFFGTSTRADGMNKKITIVLVKLNVVQQPMKS